MGNTISCDAAKVAITKQAVMDQRKRGGKWWFFDDSHSTPESLQRKHFVAEAPGVAAAANPLALSELKCWKTHKWIEDEEEETKRIYYYNEDTTVLSRDVMPVGRRVRPEAQLGGMTALDCMGKRQLLILCGESGSGKTSLALAIAKGLVIHLNFGLSTNISTNLMEMCSEKKGSSKGAAPSTAAANGIANPILNLLREYYGAPEDFALEPDQELTIVLDEMGSYSNVVHLLCGCHEAVRANLATLFGVGRVGLIVAGTGTETSSNMPGSLPSSFRLHKLPRLPDYWENHYKELVKSAKPVTRALARAARPMSEVGTSRRLVGPVHALVLRLCENARFAAILALVIRGHELNALAVLCDPAPTKREFTDEIATTNALVAVTNIAIAKFVQANALQSCQPGCLRADMAVAAELVINGATWRRAMDHSAWDALNIKYGVATSGMTKIGKNDAKKRQNDTTITMLSYVTVTPESAKKKAAGPKYAWKAGYDENGVDFLMLPHGTPVVQMSEFGAAILLLERGLLWVPDGTADGFAWTVASAAALYCMMPDVNVKDSANVDATVLTPLRLLLNGGLDRKTKKEQRATLSEDDQKMIKRWASPVPIDYTRKLDDAEPDWLANIRAWILEGAPFDHVVVINGPMASYADVIVFAPGRLVLLQCMNFEGTRLTRDVVNKVFTKMMPPLAAAAAKTTSEVAEEVAKRRALTTTLIATCLGKAPEAKEFVVEAAIVFEGPRSCIDSDVLPDGAMSASYRYGTEETKQKFAVNGVPVKFRFSVIDVTKDTTSDCLHGLHPVAQRSWV